MRETWWLLLIMIFIILCMLLPLKNQINSLAEAVNQLQICVEDGMDNCHIELDGNDYNVYGEKL